MTEEAMIVHLPPNLCMDDLIELKYSSLTDSIHLVPLENSFAALVDDDQNEETLVRGLEKSDTEQSNQVCKAMRKKLISSPLIGNDGRYCCPFCNKTFSQKYIVPRHIKSMHENFYQKCHLCNQFVKNVQQHLKFRHSEKQYIKCVICEESFESKKLLRDHLSNYHGKITLPTSIPTLKTCETCGTVLNSKKSLWLGHVYYQHMIPQRYFNCPLEDCPKTISKIEDDYNLKTHLLSYHDLKIDKIYPCHLCPKKLLSPDDFAGHLEIDHDSATEVSCVVCNKSFKKYQLMALHLYQEHKSIFRGNFTPESSTVWKCAKFPIESKRITESRVFGGLFGPKKNEALQSTKYTFIKANNAEEFDIDKPDQKDDQDDISNSIREDFEENLSKTVSDIETMDALGTEDFFLEIDQNILSKVLNIDQNNSISKEEKLRDKFHSLPKGTNILKATEDEVLLELDDSADVDEDVPILSKPEEYLVEIGQNTENKDEDQVEKEVNDVVLYLDDTLIKHSVADSDIAVVILQQNFENTVEVVARNEPENQSKFDIKRRPRQEGKFSCPIKGCRKSFVAKHSVNMHVRNVHLAPTVSCEKCGKSYSNQDNLKVRGKSKSN